DGAILLFDQAANLPTRFSPGLDLGWVATQESGCGAHGISLLFVRQHTAPTHTACIPQAREERMIDLRLEPIILCSRHEAILSSSDEDVSHEPFSIVSVRFSGCSLLVALESSSSSHAYDRDLPSHQSTTRCGTGHRHARSPLALREAARFCGNRTRPWHEL